MSKLNIDETLVRRMSKLLDETGLSEIEYEENGTKIRVSKKTTNLLDSQGLNSKSSTTQEKLITDNKDSDINAQGSVLSPMVGTIYMSSAPGEPPFVQIGDLVTKGQTILVVEAMKTFNEIIAPISGTVSKLLVIDSQPVEFGELLALIE
jgi:acetyl-CoA carboxylase biotin carboxyl carrier protein|tara:strand:+ start:1796 stop:2245 length:450 start_codon:yes stop_codon:yes gene_type:complete